MSLGDVVENVSEVAFSEACSEFALRANELNGQRRRTHGKPARRAVNFIFDFTVSESSKQNSAMFRKLCKNRLLFECMARSVTFSFKVAKFFLQPFVILGQKIDTLFEQGDMLPEDGCTAMFSDQSFNRYEKIE